MVGANENFRCLRRLGAAVGLAGAAALIGLSAAATAQADDETENFFQLVGQGLNYYEAYEVVHAEDNGLPVEVSYDGNLVVDTNQVVNPLTGAVAESGADNDIAAAIGTNSPAILNQTIADATGGSNDVAFADGGGSFAMAGSDIPSPVISDNDDTATAIGTYSFASADGGSNDSATDIGSNSFADATANHDTVYDIGSGVGNGANNIAAGGDNDFVFGFGNGLPNTDVVNTGVFDIVTPHSGTDSLSSLLAAFDLSSLDPSTVVGAGTDAAGAAADAVSGFDPLSFLGL
jgi:hypothetical protein